MLGGVSFQKGKKIRIRCCSKAVWVRKERQKVLGGGVKKNGYNSDNLMARAKGEKNKQILIRLASGGTVTPVIFVDE